MWYNVSLTLTLILQLRSSGDKFYLVILALPTLVPPFDFCIEITKSWGFLLDIRPSVLQRTYNSRICSLLILIIELNNSRRVTLHCLIDSNNWVLAHVQVCRAYCLILCWCQVLCSFMTRFFMRLNSDWFLQIVNTKFRLTTTESCKQF
jgi:hypothetical protein